MCVGGCLLRSETVDTTELQAVVSRLTWVLEIKLRSSTRAVNALNH